MRAVVGCILAAAAACLASTSALGAAPIPANQNFALFPFWQQVLTDEAAATPESAEPAAPAAAPVLMQADSLPKPAMAKRVRVVAQAQKASPLIEASYTIPMVVRPPVAQPQVPAAAGCASERRCAPAIWLSFLESLRGKSRREQLDAVNTWINARPYVEDSVNWGVADYWETPGEFFAHGGDCEDFAIVKYFSLVRLGFSPDDLKIVVLNDTKINAFHAVLSVQLDGQDWLLDNQIAQVEPIADAPQYRPIYALNERGSSMYALPVFSFRTATAAGH